MIFTLRSLIISFIINKVLFYYFYYVVLRKETSLFNTII